MTALSAVTFVLLLRQYTQAHTRALNAFLPDTPLGNIPSITAGPARRRDHAHSRSNKVGKGRGMTKKDEDEK